MPRGRFWTFTFRSGREAALWQAQIGPEVQNLHIRNSFSIGLEKRCVTPLGRVCRGTRSRRAAMTAPGPVHRARSVPPCTVCIVQIWTSRCTSAATLCHFWVLRHASMPGSHFYTFLLEMSRNSVSERHPSTRDLRICRS